MRLTDGEEGLDEREARGGNGSEEDGMHSKPTHRRVVEQKLSKTVEGLQSVTISYDQLRKWL